MTARVCWLVTGRLERAERWSRWLRARGWRVVRAAAAELAAAEPDSACVLLADLSVAWPRPAAWVARLRERRARWRVALVAEPEDAFGSRLGEALSSGADDVVPASVDAAGLAERLRRLGGEASPLLQLSDGAIRMDVRQRQAWAGRARPRRLTLTRTEFDILAALLRAKGEPLKRQDLIERVWAGDEVNGETVDRHIGALRRKLGSLRERIRTAHGKGYAAL